MARASVVSALITAAAFVAAIASNPSAERHRDAIKQATSERSPVAGALGLGALKALVSTYHTVGVASYTTSSGGHVLSMGAFGAVWVTKEPPKEP